MDDLDKFFDEDNSKKEENDDDFLSAFFDDDDDASQKDKGGDTEDDDDFLSAFFDDEPSKKEEPIEEEDDDDFLSSFFGNDDQIKDEKEGNNDDGDGADDDFFSSLFGDKKQSTRTEEEEDEENSTGLFGKVLGNFSGKPEPALPYKKDKRKAKLDITKNSKEDTTIIKRYTKAELQSQLKNDYRYMLGKPYMVIRPVVILGDYPYKKRKSDSDIIQSYNVEYDYLICIGKLLKWRSTEEFRRKPKKLGEIMYMKRGVYWVDGKQVELDPHFALVINKSYKRIKWKRIRDLLAPLKQRLRSGKPFTIYKEFPIIVKRTGAYS